MADVPKMTHEGVLTKAAADMIGYPESGMLVRFTLHPKCPTAAMNIRTSYGDKFVGNYVNIGADGIADAKLLTPA